MNLGNKIRELRREKNLTQEQLAASLNISPQAVSKWELGLSFPDMPLIPVMAGLFNVSLDELFDFHVSDVDKEIEKIRLEYGQYFWDNFEKAEQILIEGSKLYPASMQLKTELVELYAYHVDYGDEIINKAFELGSQIIHASPDIFCICRTKANLIRIYRYLEQYKNQDHYEDIKKLIESLPYMYPYMIQDRMRLSADYIKGEEGMAEARKLKDIEWQELFTACDIEGRRYFEIGDYENALNSFQQSVDVIERFMYPDQRGDEAYPIRGTYANHAIAVLDIAACGLCLERVADLEELIDKAKHIYFDAYENAELWDYGKTMHEMIDYFTEEYHKKKLDKYKPLDLSDIEKRIDERACLQCESTRKSYREESIRR